MAFVMSNCSFCGSGSHDSISCPHIPREAEVNVNDMLMFNWKKRIGIYK